MPNRNSTEKTVLIFLKAPRESTVKTRLAKSIGSAKALQAYRKMAEHQLAAIPEHWNASVCFTPSDARSEMETWLGPRNSYEEQAGGDLGERLVQAVRSHFQSGNGPLFLIGADCPWLGKKELESAAKLLETTDVVLGPAHDGGYYLLGIKQPHLSLFQSISWSSERVLEQTIQRARSHDLDIERLPKLHDVDTLEEWTLALEAFPQLRV